MGSFDLFNKPVAMQIRTAIYALSSLIVGIMLIFGLGTEVLRGQIAQLTTLVIGVMATLAVGYSGIEKKPE